MSCVDVPGFEHSRIKKPFGASHEYEQRVVPSGPDLSLQAHVLQISAQDFEFLDGLVLVCSVLLGLYEREVVLEGGGRTNVTEIIVNHIFVVVGHSIAT